MFKFTYSEKTVLKLTALIITVLFAVLLFIPISRIVQSQASPLIAILFFGGFIILLKIVEKVILAKSEIIKNFLDGDSGERQVYKEISKLDGVKIFKKVILPNSYGDIDLVVITCFKIIAVEVKNYHRVRTHKGKWYSNKKEIPDPTKQALRNATALGEYLKQNISDKNVVDKVWVKAILVFAHNNDFTDIHPYTKNVEVLKLDHVNSYISQNGLFLPEELKFDVNKILNRLTC